LGVNSRHTTAAHTDNNDDDSLICLMPIHISNKFYVTAGVLETTHSLPIPLITKPKYFVQHHHFKKSYLIYIFTRV